MHRTEGNEGKGHVLFVRPGVEAQGKRRHIQQHEVFQRGIFPLANGEDRSPTKHSQSLQPHEDKHYTYTLSLGYAERKPQHKVQGGCSPQLHTGDALGTSVRASAPFSLHVLEQTPNPNQAIGTRDPVEVKHGGFGRSIACSQA